MRRFWRPLSSSALTCFCLEVDGSWRSCLEDIFNTFSSFKMFQVDLGLIRAPGSCRSALKTTWACEDCEDCERLVSQTLESDMVNYFKRRCGPVLRDCLCKTFGCRFVPVNELNNIHSESGEGSKELYIPSEETAWFPSPKWATFSRLERPSRSTSSMFQWNKRRLAVAHVEERPAWKDKNQWIHTAGPLWHSTICSGGP